MSSDMHATQLKRLPQQFALSLAAMFASTLFVYAWPGVMHRPEALAVSELVCFALIVGLARRAPAFKRTSTALARTSAHLPQKPRQGSAPSLHDVAWWDSDVDTESAAFQKFEQFLMSTSSLNASTAPECERLLLRIDTAWASPVERITWIFPFARQDVRFSEHQ